MTLKKQIGRFEFCILSVVAISPLPDGQFEFYLPHNVKLILTAEEKALYDQAMGFHNDVMYYYGVAKGAGLRA